ncbi:MAG: hypothetical protein KAH23_07525 [Kiritimatiellae bacterium]|nr:hypothetical protein [Kiritimatiellia bacterium]
MAEDDDFVEPDPDSGILIQEALQRGEITLEESVALNYDAWLAPETLPFEYQSDEPFVWRTMQRDMQWIINSYSTLSLEDQEKYASFLLDPTDPLSDFYPEEMSTSSKAPGEYGFKTIDFMHNGVKKATIYYLEPEGQVTEQATKAEWVKTALLDCWDEYEKLFSAEPEFIPIYLIGLLDLEGWYGVVTYQDLDLDGVFSYKVFIDSSMNREYTKSTTVHEIFHCFQDTVSIPDSNAHMWLQEATAVWSEDFIYPSSMVEWEYLDQAFSNFGKDRIRFDGQWEYSNYLFFFFATQYLDRNDFIVKMLKDSKTMPVADAVMTNFADFGSLYAQYARYNLNLFDWKLYKDKPDFKKISPKYNSIDTYDYYSSGVVPENKTITKTLGRGGIIYEVFWFAADADKPKRLEFDLSKTPDDPNIHVQAFYGIGTNYFEEDWTYESHPFFCRTEESERVVMVILVISNADLKNQKTITYDMKVDGDCNSPEGSINYFETFSVDGSSFATDFKQRDTLEYDAARGAYVVVSSTKVYNSNSVDIVVLGEGIPECTITTTSIGTLDYVYPENERPSRILLKPDGSLETIDLEADDHDPENWITRTVESTCGDTQIEQIDPILIMGGVNLTSADISSTSIQGSRSHDFGDMHVDIVFSYDRLLGE